MPSKCTKLDPLAVYTTFSCKAVKHLAQNLSFMPKLIYKTCAHVNQVQNPDISAGSVPVSIKDKN